MANIGMSELKKGLKIEVDGIPYKITEYQHVKPGELLQFMDTTTYEQIGLTYDQVGETADWIIDGMTVDMMFFNGNAITVEPPMVVELKIVETPPNFKGDSQGGRKPATLESGAVVQIPFHILEGDVIRCDTRTGEYIEKVK